MTDLVALVTELEAGLVQMTIKMHQQRGALALAKQLLAEQRRSSTSGSTTRLSSPKSELEDGGEVGIGTVTVRRLD